MLNSRQRFLLFNFLGFQLTWFACAYGATHALPYLGALVGLVFIVMHFIFTANRSLDMKVLFIIAILGVMLDYMNTQFGLISFPGHNAEHFILPFWLIALWCSFALILPHSLFWLAKNIYLASLAGGIGGGFSYLAGHKLGALSLSEPLMKSGIIYAIEWAIILPLGLCAVKYFLQEPSVVK